MDTIKLPTSNFIPKETKTPLITHEVGTYKFKDKKGRQAVSITNPKGGLMVIKELHLIKKHGSNNEIIIKFVMPDPKDIEVVENK